ncbi:P-loop containing nucleoside triphosphate hydrolase protein [Cokeromyces recurvatus]|uniref:P-loop containing nucleoside triphosphate hydrolase protein n=1 Tax=Cokeromyces recurvatus TaxID=90255 RepID=UPI0022204F0C|nr:P-loop containing nucleoside triphosphate hydrolase protein [Cokeromyces recurvatus]KAI7902715.1 P-loop containing nucleoside triphosphate hydrolase protein [Cokeromyces recurvatus]
MSQSTTIADLTQLSREPSSDEIAEILRQRYLNGFIYTNIGPSVLIVLNSFDTNNKDKQANDKANYITEYKDTSSAKTNQWREPHLYQLINHAYLIMRRTNMNQYILFSGESGSGKSEQFKQSIDYLISLSTHRKTTRTQSNIVHAQTIIHAFSHAKTNQHDNASRCALFSEIHFSERGRLIGARFLPYALEKSRVTEAGQNERSFHVFYNLLSAATSEEKSVLRLSDWSTFQYLSRTNTSKASSLDDLSSDIELRNALKSILPQKYRVSQIFQVLAAILHLGNIHFIQDSQNAQDAATVKNIDSLTITADLLGVDPNSLLSTLTFKSKLIKRDITTLFLDAKQSSKHRDDLAQSLYSLLFTWLVEQINNRLAPKNSHRLIGLLDIPGWVYSKQNGSEFDQLAFHFIQETVHQLMYAHIFEHDRQEYAEQGMTSNLIENTPASTAIVDLFMHPSKGLWSIMNTQASGQQQQQRYTDDETLMDNYARANKSAIKDQILSFKKADNNSKLFTIQHFWGSATYDPQYFTERNQDYLSNDFITLFAGNAYNPPTTNSLISCLFNSKILGQDDSTQNRVFSQQQGIRPLRSPTVGPSSNLSIARYRKSIDVSQILSTSLQSDVSSVADLLVTGINDLSKALSSSLLWSVLCIRPNDLSLPRSCDIKKIAVQQRHFKFSELIRHIKKGYYIAVFTFEEFWNRYYASIPNTVNTIVDSSLGLRDKCIYVAQSMNWGDDIMTIGKTKVFLSNHAFRILEDDLRSLEKSETKKVKNSLMDSGIHGQKSFDLCSYNDDLISSAISEDDYTNESAIYDLNGSNVFSGAGNENRQTMLMSPDKFSSDYYQTAGLNGPNFKGEKSKDIGDEANEPMSNIRCKWIIFVWLLTWWAPSPFLNYCGGMKRRDVRLAWREKVVLCMLIFFLSSVMVVFIIFFGPLICPHQDVYSLSELQSRSTKKSALVTIRGEVFDLTKFAPHHWASEVIPDNAIYDYAGKDATNLFPVQVSSLCDGVTGRIPEELVLDFQYNLTDKNAAYHDFRFFTDDYRPDWYFEQMVFLRRNYRIGFMGYEPSDIIRQATNVVNVGDISTHRSWAVLHGDVYDMTYYLLGGRTPRAPVGIAPPENLDLNFMENSIVQLFRQLAGTDISKHFDALPISPELRMRQLVCLRNLFFVGKVDTRRSLQCLFSEYFLLIVTGFLCAVILFKFLAALQLGSFREPEDYDKFIVCQVPCYTESEESLRKTIDSIAVLRYDDKRKLLFLVCDGMIIGSGNDRPTPRIVLDILGVDPNVDPEPLSFLSLGESIKQHNQAKIYSGLYECSGHVVPYVVVVKVGAPNERVKPGNRGKRDSQMVLMRFLNKVHFEAPMTPMELEIYHQIKNVIGVNPGFYEFILMVDADTEVLPDSLNRMVSCFVHDSKVVGLCGETRLANEKDSWVTGCFCMYRIRSPGVKNQPLLVSNQVIDDYAENRVNTLHQKNLLHLGEDRYLTTLILKHFPTYKTKFTADAGCLTNAPDRWSVLLSQRRRWINSTIHNLGELVFLPQLCGFCCFSMRFVVILDLLSTLVMPAVVCYLGFLIYRLITNADQVPFISIITLCGVYGLQAIIFIVRRKWEHIGWMIVYILAIPIFSFFIPIYAFWHFDDFSWGNTRVVLGDDGQKKVLTVEEGKFDPKSIPLKKWNEHENEIWETGSVETKGTAITASTTHRTAAGVPTLGSYTSVNSNFLTPPPPPPALSYPASMSHLPMTSSASFIGGNNQLYNGDNLSFRYSHQNLSGPASSVMLNSNPMLNLGPPQHMHMLSSTSVYSGEGSVHGDDIALHQQGYSPIISNTMMMDNNSSFHPTDEEIRRAVQYITATADLTTVTKKQVREQLSRHFGVNMMYKKDFINVCIEETLNY